MGDCRRTNAKKSLSTSLRKYLPLPERTTRLSREKNREKKCKGNRSQVIQLDDCLPRKRPRVGGKDRGEERQLAGKPKTSARSHLGQKRSFKEPDVRLA